MIEVRAYVKTASNVTIYKNNWVWWKINYGVKLLTSASTLKVANNEEEDVFSWETDDRKEEEEYIEDDSAWYEERVDRENSWESIESEYSEENEATYEEEYSEEEEWVEVNAVFTTFLVVLSFVWLVAVLSSFDDMQPVFPVMKLKPLFAGINPLKNVLQINSKAHLDWLAGKAWVWASKIYNVLVGKFGKVKTVSEIRSVATSNAWNTSWLPSWAATILNWNYDDASKIIDLLIKKWWIYTKYIDSGAWKFIKVYEKNWEKINFRNFWSSDINYINAWFKANATFDTIWSTWRNVEIKFLTK